MGSLGMTVEKWMPARPAVGGEVGGRFAMLSVVLDVLGHVVKTFTKRRHDESREMYKIPHSSKKNGNAAGRRQDGQGFLQKGER